MKNEEKKNSGELEVSKEVEDELKEHIKKFCYPQENDYKSNRQNARQSEYTFCFYCGARAHKKSAMGDHFPIPDCLGGQIRVPCCRTCHDMKDRVGFSNWSPTWKKKALKELFGDDNEMGLVFKEDNVEGYTRNFLEAYKEFVMEYKQDDTTSLDDRPNHKKFISTIESFPNNWLDDVVRDMMWWCAEGQINKELTDRVSIPSRLLLGQLLCLHLDDTAWGKKKYKQIKNKKNAVKK
jgi:hypothetical protein